MIADIRPLVTLDPEEAQLNEDGGLDANKWDNCGAAYYAWALKQLGNGDPFEPQKIMDMIHGVGWHGGEISSRLLAFFSAHRAQYPKLPAITIEQGGDIVARARAVLQQSMLSTNWWWCDSGGVIQARNTGILHWSGAVYDTGTALGIWNIMHGQVVELPYAYARAAYAGEFTVFHQSLTGGFDVIHPSVFAAVFRSVQLIAVTQAPDYPMIDKYVKQVEPDGGNLDAMVQKMISTEPFFAEYRRRLAGALDEVDTLARGSHPLAPGTSFTAVVK